MFYVIILQNKHLDLKKDVDGYYIVRTEKGQSRPKYIFKNCGTNIYFVTL